MKISASSIFLIFLVLKLTDYIDWSWVWVTAPLWMQVAAWGMIVIPVFIIAAVAGVLDRNA